MSTVSWAASDALHSLLVKRAGALMGCIEGSEQEAELQRLPMRSTPTRRSAGPTVRCRPEGAEAARA